MKFKLTKNEKQQVVNVEREEKDVKVKISYCPECNGAVRVGIEHTMSKKDKLEFMNEVFDNHLSFKTLSLEEYRTDNIKMYCAENCSKKTKS